MTNKCTIVRRRILTPCTDLALAAEPAGTQARGIHITDVQATISGQDMSRRFAIVRSGGVRQGAVLDFCPFCGVQIGKAYHA